MEKFDMGRSRFRRRRFLTGAASGLASAAFLAACGSGDDDETQGPTGGTAAGATGPSSLISPIVDETDTAVRGGVFLSTHGAPANLDPHQLDAGVLHVWHNYSQLFKMIEGRMELPPGGMEGELAESWEFSPDNLQLTVKLTHDIAFAPLPPVNGRKVDAHDVVFSWERYKELSPRRNELANDINPGAPIVSVEAIDDETVVLTLARPQSIVLSQLGNAFAGTYFIVPKEAADQSVLDLRRVGAGSGPFYLSELIQSVSHSYKRNPGFNKDPRNVPYVDEVRFAELPEYAAQLAQLRAGRIYDSYFNFRAEDILPTKRDVPELDVQPSLIYSLILRAFFGMAPESPFSDDRVRQAYVQTWDRELFLDTAFNVRNFEDGGLPVETALESGVNAGAWQGYWLDPRSDAFGDNTKYFSENLEDSRRLLEAAGHADGVDFDLYYVSSPLNQHLIQMLTAMTTDSGLFRPEHKILTGAEFNADIRSNRGNFVGAGFITDNNEPDPVVDLIAHYHSSGGRYLGGDEHMDDLLDRAAAEFDVERQKTLAHDIQRYEGEKHFQPRVGGGTGYRITWPALRNKGVWGGPFHSSFLRWNATVWLDQTRPPLNQSGR